MEAHSLKQIFCARFFSLLLAATLPFCAGCGTYIAHRLTQAPNTYPDWFAPDAQVSLEFADALLANYPSRYLEVGPPEATLRYRVLDAVPWRVKTTMEIKRQPNGHTNFLFSFSAVPPAKTNQPAMEARGTVILLHGYGEAQFAMLPWAMWLSSKGWRCVLVDLRGHGKSTGGEIYFGLQETNDLTHLLDVLDREGNATGPVSVMGESYGAALALRWAAVEPRVGPVVAIAPYCVLSNAVMNIRNRFEPWFPAFLLNSGISHLPQVLQCQPGDLDTTTVMARHPVKALYVSSTGDRIIPLREVEGLEKMSGPGSRLVVVPGALHEALPYYFDQLAPPVEGWLEGHPQL